MSDNLCKHCGAELYQYQPTCPKCGAPVPSSDGDSRRTFKLLFILLIIFCVIAILWLPR